MCMPQALGADSPPLGGFMLGGTAIKTPAYLNRVSRYSSKSPLFAWGERVGLLKVVRGNFRISVKAQDKAHGYAIYDFGGRKPVDLIFENMLQPRFSVREMLFDFFAVEQALDNFRDKGPDCMYRSMNVLSGLSKHPGVSSSSISTILITISLGV